MIRGWNPVFGLAAKRESSCRQAPSIFSRTGRSAGCDRANSRVTDVPGPIILKPTWNRDMSVDPAAIRNVLDDSSEAKAKSADPKRFYDNSIIQQVNREHAAKLFPGEVK